MQKDLRNGFQQYLNKYIERSSIKCHGITSVSRGVSSPSADKCQSARRGDDLLDSNVTRDLNTED